MKQHLVSCVKFSLNNSANTVSYVDTNNQSSMLVPLKKLPCTRSKGRVGFDGIQIILKNVLYQCHLLIVKAQK